MALQAPLIAGEWRPAKEGGRHFRAVNPASGTAMGPTFPVSTGTEVEMAL